MNIIIDLLGSIVIAGILLLMMFNAEVYQSSTGFASDSELQMQQNARTLADIVSYDLRKIGYECKTNPFLAADSERVSFYADMDRDGTQDIVTYFVSDTSYARSTKNPNDRVLIRVVNNDSIAGPSLGLTKIKFSYFDDVGTPVTDFNQISFIKAELWIESIEPVNDKYLFTYWELTISPRNL
jgi:Tfp pilus assembly protein PilW